MVFCAVIVHVVSSTRETSLCGQTWTLGVTHFFFFLFLPLPPLFFFDPPDKSFFPLPLLSPPPIPCMLLSPMPLLQSQIFRNLFFPPVTPLRHQWDANLLNVPSSRCFLTPFFVVGFIVSFGAVGLFWDRISLFLGSLTLSLPKTES